MSEGSKIELGIPMLWLGAFLTMLVIKLAGVADLSWWVVTAPLWGQVVIFLLLLSIVSVVTIGQVAINWIKQKLKK